MTPTTLRADIGDRAFTLNFNFNAMRMAEKELGQPIMSVFQKDGAGEVKISFDALSALWWAVLQRKHRITREACDTLVDEAGLDAVAGWLTEGLSAYFGVAGDSEPDEGDEGKGKGARKKA